MAINIPIVTDFNSKGLQDAQNALKHFQSKVGEAEGAFGKMKAGFGAAGDFIRANSGMIATVAGGAIAGFAIKAVGDFQDLALSVDKFRDATGLTLEQASKWTEYAGDIGLDAGAIQTAINKMNREASKGEDYFNKLGVEMKKHADGTYDPQGTFLEVIDTLKGIKDPAEKAKIATQLLGKGWTELSDLINKGSGELLTNLNAVSDSKIIDEDEVRKAEEFRDRMDKLKDTFGDIALELGEALVPLLSDVLDLLQPLISGMKLLFPDDLLEEPIRQAKLLKETTAKWNGVLGDNRSALNDARYALEKASGAADTFDSDLNGLIDTWDIFLGKLSIEEQRINLEEDFQRATDAAWKALAENTPEAWREADKARINAQQGVAEYIKKLGNIPPEIQSKILALIDKGAYDEVKRLLDELAKTRTVNYRPIRPGDTPSETTGRGTATSRSRMDIFGPASALSTSAYSINVNVAGSVTSEGDLIEAIRKGLVSAQRNGAQLVYSNV